MNIRMVLTWVNKLVCTLIAVTIAIDQIEAQEAKPYTPERIPSEFDSSPPSEPPVPEPNPECLIEGKMEWDWWYGFTTYRLSDIVTKRGEARTSVCVDRMIDRVRQRCADPGNFIAGLGFGPGSPTHSHYFDDCFVQTLSIQLFPDFNGRSSKIGSHSNGAVCTAPVSSDLKFCPPRLGGIMGCTPCGEGRFYLNESCDVVPPDPSLAICGKLTTNYQASSPISLIWDGRDDIESNTTAVQFPLNPHLIGKWYQWKASSSAPLLVYDPSHSGKIESAEQLFGEWTLGGKRVASTRHSNDLGGPWKNGFEALTVMDADKNGIIEGRELRPLALWFDKNRDGQSQKGEVRSLKDVGVTKLFTSVDYEQSETGSLWSYRGYERTLGARTFYGKSVDWYGVTGNSPLDVAAKLPSLSIPRSALSSEVDEIGTTDSSIGAGEAKTNRLSGIWRFDFEGESAGTFPAGYLILADRGEQDGKLTGYSVVNKEFQLASSSKKNGLVTMYPIEGVKEIGEEQTQQIRFVIQGEDSQIRSKAVIAPDGMSMSGTSSVVRADGNRISYRWVAIRDSNPK